MPVLYLTEQGSIVRKTSDRLIVEKDHEVLLEIPCLKLDRVLIFGNVQVTTQGWPRCSTMASSSPSSRAAAACAAN